LAHQRPARHAGPGDVGQGEQAQGREKAERFDLGRYGLQRRLVGQLQVAFGVQLVRGDARHMAAGQANGLSVRLCQADRLIG
jgi:hypothetical protein